MRRPGIRFTVRRLMVVVAVVGVLLWAWLYRAHYGDVERSLTSLRLREFAEGDAAQRRMAVEFLAYTEPDELLRVLPVLADAAADDDWRIRLAAVRSVGSAARRGLVAGNQIAGEETATARRILIRAFGDPRDEVRVEAVRNLDQLAAAVHSATAKARGPKGLPAVVQKDTQAVAPLLRLMEDRVAEVRAAAALAFARIQPETGEGPEPVIRMMSDREFKVRVAADEALAIGWGDREGIYPVLLRQLKEVDSREERAAIGWALSRLGAPPPESISVLLEALARDEWALNQTISEVLMKLGPAGRPALPALAKLAAREFTVPEGAALRAAMAVARIDRDSTEAQALLAPLAARLRDSPNSFDHQQAAWVLSVYGPSAAAAVPALRGALKSDVADVRERAASLLGSFGPTARPALVDLSALADRDPDPSIRRTAAQAIKRIDLE